MDGIAAPAKSLRRGTLAIYKYYDAHPSELTLSLVLFSGDRGKKFGAGLDEALKQQLDELLALLVEQVRKVTAKPFLPMVRLEATALITYLVGLLVLKQRPEDRRARKQRVGPSGALYQEHGYATGRGRLRRRSSPPGERDEKCGG